MYDADEGESLNKAAAWGREPSPLGSFVPYHFWLLKQLVAWLLFNHSILLKMVGNPKGFDYIIAIIMISPNQIRAILIASPCFKVRGGQCRYWSKGCAMDPIARILM